MHSDMFVFNVFTITCKHRTFERQENNWPTVRFGLKINEQCNWFGHVLLQHTVFLHSISVKFWCNDHLVRLRSNWWTKYYIPYNVSTCLYSNEGCSKVKVTSIKYLLEKCSKGQLTKVPVFTKCWNCIEIQKGHSKYLSKSF